MIKRALVEQTTHKFEGVFLENDYTLRACFTNLSTFNTERYSLSDLKDKMEKMARNGHTSAALAEGCTALEAKPPVVQPSARSGVQPKT